MVIILAIIPFIYMNNNSLTNEIVTKEVAYDVSDKSESQNLLVWDNLTKEELIEKLNKNLYNELSGTGSFFADYTMKTGLDPYLAVSIVNLETGCKWGCSYLAKVCYNIGGLKGMPNCGGGYAKFNSLEEGINSYLDIIYNNYWSLGLTTPEAINPKYAASNLWAEKVNKYYQEIVES